jgi:murein DD-endopeptidase MepM/ murein hydrolase activator NlpD
MTNPVPGYKITTPYGKPGSWSAGYHTGNDYAAPSGTVVVATRAGKVTKSQWDGDYGNRIEILTDGVEHSYSHLSALSVWYGELVAEGQQVGKVGSTGNSTGPHLHYEERHGPGYGYSDDRRPQFDVTAAQPEPEPEPQKPEEAEMFMVIRAPSGASYLLCGSGVASGIYDGTPIGDFESQGVPVVDCDQQTFDAAMAGREVRTA